MIYTIQNDFLTVDITSLGGELQSIRTPDNTEYLWQGDAATWTDRAPNLFPYIARLTNGTYTYKGNPYSMDIHGFLKDSELKCCEHEGDSLKLCLTDSDTTKKQYPFSFTLTLKYQLEKNTLKLTYITENKGNETMYFGIGGHPGFRVPLDSSENFEDYFLEFETSASPKHLLFTKDCFVTDEEKKFSLSQDSRLSLHHQLFDEDAIILRDAGSSICLKSNKSSRSVAVSFPGFSYLGLWHWPRTDVNYLCIEPWTSLPSRKDVVEDLETQPSLIALSANDVCEKEWSVTIS